MRKKIVAIAISVLIVLAAFALVKVLPSGRDTEDVVEKVKPALIEVIYPKRGDIAYNLSSTGKIVAAERFEIFSQVDGVLLPLAKVFKIGKTYKKGEKMLQIEVDEFKMTLLAQKSDFITLLTSVLPDLKSDYPNSYENWREYALSLDVYKPLPELPKPNGSQEKFFLSGHGIFSSFYHIQSSEERLKKYTIRAPYDGIVTSTKVEAGKAVMPGSELGQFINTTYYDLEVTIPISAMNDIAIGTKANLSSTELNEEWKGKVTRVSGDIDELSQSVRVFIRTSGHHLKEGMYLTAKIAMPAIQNAFSLPRKMVNDNNEVFVVIDNALQLKKVHVLMRQGDNAIVQGLSSSEAVLSTVIKNAYDGMPVRVNQ